MSPGKGTNRWFGFARLVYSTITLAVYGILTNSLTENIASPPPVPCEPEELEELPTISVEASLVEEDLKEEWKEPLPSDITAHAHDHKDMDYEGLRV